MRGTWLALSVASCALVGCGDHKPKPVSVGLATTDECDGRPNGVLCLEGAALTCSDGGVASRDECADAGLSCNPDRGCQRCTPNFLGCEGNRLMRCDETGRSLSFVEECASGLQCSSRGCRDLCAEAEAQRSYIGCDYWPVFTANSQLDPLFDPAVVIANPNLVDAQVTITQGGEPVAEVTVPQSSVQSVMLKFDAALKGGLGSVLVRNGAYHLVSSVPVTVHQFNPMLFEVEQDCVLPEQGGLQKPGDMKCNSFTNDASLLLPSHVLTRSEDRGVSYVAISRGSFLAKQKASDQVYQGLPGFLAIVGADNRPVNVTIRSSAYTLGAADGSLRALRPGDTQEVMLMPGDVLQLLSDVPSTCPGQMGIADGRPVCDPGPEYDLTGTEIQADGAVEVIGGHDCSYVPFDRVACDHLEESMFPLETWGDTVVVTRPRSAVGATYRLRVVSGADGNAISFDPPVHETITLDRGQQLELETSEHVIVHGEKPLAVAQYLLGQGATSRIGDPSLSLALPVDQYRSSYSFLSPDTYTSNYVTVVSSVGDTVVLDEETVLDVEAVSGSTYQVSTVRLDKAGQHEVHSQTGSTLGLVLYGFGDYTSYMLPGGLDLRLISSPL